MLATPPLVGRAPDLAAIGAVLDAPEGRGVLVTGPVGVGKSRLAAEVMARQAAAGTVVLRAIATAATADIPLGALAAIAPGGVRAGDRPDGVAERVAADLAVEAASAPLLLVVDDVDLLDAQSHAVIRTLVARSIARVVGTVRSPHPVLPAPWTGPGIVQLTLGDLDDDGVAEVLVATLGGPVAGATTRLLASATRGNPLLLREALAAAGGAGALRQVDGIWSLADGEQPLHRLGDVVRERIGRLDSPERDGLELVAVAEVLPVALADALVGPAVLAQLERSGLVVLETALGRPVVRPSHPVYGEALRSGLGPIALRHHARRLADGAEAAAGTVDVLRVVAWRVAAGDEVRADLLAGAAREARRRSEFDRAEDLARRAVEAGGGTAARLLLGEIQSAVGRFVAADETCRRVIDPLLAGEAPPEGEGEASLVGLTALALAFNRAWGLGQGREARALLHDASAALGRSPAAGTVVVAGRRLELAADAAALAAFTGDPARAVAEAEELLAHAEQPREVARAAFASAAGLLGLGRPLAAVERSERGLAALDGLPPGFGRATFATNLLLTRVVGRADAGDLAGAARLAEDAYRRSVDASLRTGQAVVAWARGYVLDGQGRAHSAERWLGEARLIERDLQTRGRRRWSLIGLGLSLLAQGRRTEAATVLATLDRLDDEEPVDDRFLWADEVRLRAAVLAGGGELTVAERLLADGAARAEAEGGTAAAVVLWHELVVSAPTRRGAGGAAARLAAVHGVEGALHRARVADAAAAAADDGAARLAVAADLAGAGAHRMALAIARSVAVGAGVEGRRGLARNAEELGARSAAACEGVPADAPARALLAGLGPRQREVVLLAAQGLANGEIAERLSIAVRTVENHLHRSYAELGVEGRRGLLALLDEG